MVITCILTLLKCVNCPARNIPQPLFKCATINFFIGHMQSSGTEWEEVIRPGEDVLRRPQVMGYSSVPGTLRRATSLH